MRIFHVARTLALVSCHLAVAYLAVGCDPYRSVNPFYRPEDVIFDAGVLGSWKDTDPSEHGTLIVGAHTPDSYVFVLTEPDKDTKQEFVWTLDTHLFKFQEETYVDLFPIAFRVKARTEKIQLDAKDLEFFVPAHIAMRLHYDNKNLVFSWTEQDGLTSLFKKEDDASKQRRLAWERKREAMLTTPTELLQKEVLGARPEGRTTSEVEMHFVRKN